MTKYKAIKVNGKKVDEHRYIMEQALGRPLTRNEGVHHKNGDPRDNRLENLELMTRAEHGRLHGLGRTVPQTTRNKLGEYHRRVGHQYYPERLALTKDAFEFIRDNYVPRSREFGARALARRFGVSHCTVLEVIHNTRGSYAPYSA